MTSDLVQLPQSLLRVLVLRPTDEHASEVIAALCRSDVSVVECSTVAALCEQIERGAAVIVLDEAQLDTAAQMRVADSLAQQPAWCEPAVVVLRSPQTGNGHTAAQAAAEALRGLDCPRHLPSLSHLLRLLLRGRRQQLTARMELPALAGELKLLYEIAAAANEADAVEPVVQFALQRTCGHYGWCFGHAYLPSEDAPNDRRGGQLCYERPIGRWRELRHRLAEMIARPGVGLAGQVLRSGEPQTASPLDESFWKTLGPGFAEASLRSAIAAPVLIRSEIVAIVEFFSQRPQPLDAGLRETLMAIGIQLGRVFERHRAAADLQQRQFFIEQVTDNVPLILYMYDLIERQTVYVNSQVFKMLGHPPRLAIIDDLCHPDDLPVLDDARYRAALAKDDEIVQCELRVRDSAGRWRWFRLHSVVFDRDPDGRTRHLMGAAQEITQWKEAQAEIQELQREIVDLAVREQRRISQDLHDDVGQELTGLKYLVENLQQRLRVRGLDEAETAARIAQVTRRLTSRVRRLARGLHPVEVDAAGLMNALDDLARQTTATFGTPCAFEHDEPVLVQNNFVATQLYRIAQEAITNSIKHSGAGRVVVSLRQTDTTVQLSVADNGKGFDPACPHSDGLGLRIMRYRASIIGGLLNIQSTQSCGTFITCTVKKDQREDEHSKDDHHPQSTDPDCR